MPRSFSRLFFWSSACLMLVMIAVGGSSCKKEQLLSSGGELRFSTDTLTFDTVFTTMGSATVGVKIYNPQSQKVTVSSVRMAQGAASPFRLNVDGKAGPGTGIDIAANDSVYVYATVKVDPNDQNSPFVVEDRLVATLNGTDFSIPVTAYGQNAHYIVNDTAISETTLQTDKPYVIIGYAIVAPGKTLNILPGTRIYMHQNARLYVAGTLNALGTKKDSIIFQGDRLDRSYYGYEGYPGEWGGLYFDSYSTGNTLRHVILRNCGRPTQGAAAAAIQVAPDSVSDFPTRQLTLDRCTIENSIGYGVLSFAGDIQATNSLFHSCGASTLALVQGGTYDFDNCTIATYGNTKISHTDNPVAVLLNYYVYDQKQPPLQGALQASFSNCVVAGSLEQEFIADSLAGYPAQVNLRNCVLKMDPAKVRPWVNQVNVRYTLPDGTLDPMFVDVSKWNFRLKQASPLIDAGAAIANPVDLDDEARPKGAASDIGAYESF